LSVLTGCIGKRFDLYIFDSLNEVRECTERFIGEHNEDRPHESLGAMTPVGFAAQIIAGKSLLLAGPRKGNFTVPFELFAISTNDFFAAKVVWAFTNSSAIRSMLLS